MNEGEIKLQSEAKDFIKQNEERLIKKYADPAIHKPVSVPISLFMAGSPGAGKTEVSRSFMKKFQDVPIRIDADEIRKECPGYNGTNAHIFHSAAVKGVNMLFDYALHNNINLILDGTFSYGDAMKNIERSLAHKRIVEVWFVYQKPELAWEFTKARETIETRRVIKEKFIEAFLKSRINAIAAKKQFGDSIELNILIKNIDNTDGKFYLNIQYDELDRYLGGSYTEDQLKVLIT